MAEKDGATLTETQLIDPEVRAQEYLQEPYTKIFKAHGIDEKYHNKWFFNYFPETEKRQGDIDIITEHARNDLPLAILGEVGNGKTHLAIALLKDKIIQTMKPDAGHYYTLTDLHRKFRDSQSNPNKSEVKFYNELSQTNCLVIDEIQIRSNSDSEQRMVQELLDKRYSANKQTVFVGNISLDEFKEFLGERLVDRIREQQIQVLMFTGKSYR